MRELILVASLALAAGACSSVPSATSVTHRVLPASTGAADRCRVDTGALIPTGWPADVRIPADAAIVSATEENGVIRLQLLTAGNYLEILSGYKAQLPAAGFQAVRDESEEGEADALFYRKQETLLVRTLDGCGAGQSELRLAWAS